MAEKIETHGTYDGANWVSLCGSCLLLGIIDDQIEEKIVTAQRPANLAAALQMDEQFFVHKLRMQRNYISMERTTRQMLGRMDWHLFEFRLRCFGHCRVSWSKGKT